MDDTDKAAFDAEMLRRIGAELDADIGASLAAGLTEEQGEDIALSLLRAMAP